MQAQVRQLFPSARGLKCTWHSIVKIMQSLYNEAPGVLGRAEARGLRTVCWLCSPRIQALEGSQAMLTLAQCALG